jgi:dienelactone hydrolase/tRNA A-37 threonylcarbamoyl transferase component Bud32
MVEHGSSLPALLSGRYAVEETIGRGGMATVYRMRDVRHDRDVAVKVLDPELSRTLGPERFLREIRIAAQLTHPHILTLHDSGEADGMLYYVTPLLTGGSLSDRLRQEPRLPVEEALRITCEVATALAHAHRQGIVHRDIKPENILLDAGGDALLADFGVASALDSAGERLTVTGVSLGTPTYMSPEQVTADSAPDGRSDIYSLGCVLFEMLAGEPPFNGPTGHAILARRLTESAPGIRTVRPDVPERLEQVLLRAMERGPADRYESADAFHAALMACAHAAAHVATGSGLRARFRRAPGLYAAAALGLALLVGGGLRQFGVLGTADVRMSLAAVTEVERALDGEEWIAAYRLAEAMPDGVADSVRDALRAAASGTGTLLSDPPGAAVAWRPFDEPEGEWVELGTTPLEARLPRGLVAIRLEHEGYVPRIVGLTPGSEPATWRLSRAAEAEADALHVPGGETGLAAVTIRLAPRVVISDYLIDRFEVTNRQFREFVDDGGYQTGELWEHPFVRDGRQIPWEDAVAAFVDRTGRPGPSTWEVGTFLPGTEDHPVTGVSWYEAQAYARYTGRELPTLYHWFRAAGIHNSNVVVPLSNLQGSGTAPVGQFPAVTVTGAFDMAGNAREWLVNPVTGDLRYTVGGGWNDPDYAFTIPQPQPAFDRSSANGLRLITDLGSQEAYAAAAVPIARSQRDFAAEVPASDEVFNAYLSLYDYDDASLDAVVESVDTVEIGIRERVTFDAAYGGERMVLYLFRPTRQSEHLQTVVYFPGNGAVEEANISSRSGPGSLVAFLVQSGRMVAFPVYKSTYERRDGFVYLASKTSSVWREQVIRWKQDLMRSLDYLETRADVEADRIVYFGHSWGGMMGPIMLAREPRFSAAVFYVAGYSLEEVQPVVDPFHFAPRVRVPLLMINARFDYLFPVETSALPLFEHIGSPVKKHFVSETGHALDGSHVVPRNEVIRETLDWFDGHLGRVR